VARIAPQAGKVIQIPCVSELVDIQHDLIGLREPTLHKIAADKTGSASN
jgi:hypothetical protein